MSALELSLTLLLNMDINGAYVCNKVMSNKPKVRVNFCLQFAYTRKGH